MLEKLYLREVVIIVDDIPKFGEEEIIEALEVDEMEMKVEVTRNHAGRVLVWMIEQNVRPFRAKMRQRHRM